MSNGREILKPGEMKLPERSRWGTFCAMEQQACDLLVTAFRMLGGAEQSSAAGDAAVAVRDGKILETGSAAELEARWTPSVRRDLGNALLMPGLINAHTHVPMTFLRGFADDLPLMEWLTGHIFPVEARLTDKIVSLGARLGMYEMMRTGTTAFVDSYPLCGIRATCTLPRPEKRSACSRYRASAPSHPPYAGEGKAKTTSPPTQRIPMRSASWRTLASNR